LCSYVSGDDARFGRAAPASAELPWAEMAFVSSIIEAFDLGGTRRHT
jgi:hypothetical protein